MDLPFSRWLVFLGLVALAVTAFGEAQDGRATLLQPILAAPFERAAFEAFAGPDLAGKDGPLARVGFDLARVWQAASDPGALDGLRADPARLPGGIRLRGERVLIDAVATGTGAELLADLEALGLERGVAFGRVVSGELPVEAIPRAAALTSLAGATPSRFALAVGAAESQGDEAMNADLARLAYGVDGSGVAVGTLSDSYACRTTAPTAADDVASGDLPAGVTVLQEGPCPASDEGRGMMQLVHDVAPGSSQLFHTAFAGIADFAQGILDLAAAGADVIVDDVIYFAEPMFQDGVIAQAADQVVAAGVPYFSSVGNSGTDSYESAWRTTSFAGGTFHDFDPSGIANPLQQVLIPAGASVTIALQWDDPAASVGVGNPGADGDLDLLLLNAGGTAAFAVSLDDNLASGEPVEILSFTNTTGSDLTANVAIQFFAGAEPSFVKYVFFGAMTVTQFATDSPTGYGHANAAGAEAVGAACYCDTPEFGQDPPLPEGFTSLGGVPIFFDTAGTRLASPEVRLKPQITAPDGTDTTFFGSGDFDGTGFPNFFGTSAAAPHAAAVAALLLDANGSLTPDEIYDLLEASAIDMAGPGFDFRTGFGLIQADDALALASASPGTVGFAAASFDVDENAGSATITVRRTGGSDGAASVNYATSDGSAEAGSDYDATSGTLSWADGDDADKSFTVPITDDGDDETDETVELSLSNPVGAALGTASAILTIADDDIGAVGFAAASFGVDEADGTATVTVRRTGGTVGAASVNYATSDGSAAAGSDYSATSGTLSWADGDGSDKSFTVAIVDDGDVEGSETVELSLSNPVGAALGTASATLTIADDDAPPADELAFAKGTASPAATVAAEPGDAVTVLQVVASVPAGSAAIAIDGLTLRLVSTGPDGGLGDVSRVRLYLDADADGAIDPGSSALAVVAPNGASDAVLAPSALTVPAGEERALLLQVEFDGALALWPPGVALAALGLPLLIALAGRRRRRLPWLAALATLVLLTGCAVQPPQPPQPEPRTGRFTTELVSAQASTDPGDTPVTPTGLPIPGSTVTIRD